MKFYFSGISANGAFPEQVLTECEMMLTFYTSYDPILKKKPVGEVTEKFPLEARFRRMHEARLAALEKENHKGKKHKHKKKNHK